MLELEKNLIYNELGRLISDYILKEKINFEAILQNKTEKILFSILEIISNEQLSDFQKVDDIVTLLNKYHLDTGNCHDF